MAVGLGLAGAAGPRADCWPGLASGVLGCCVHPLEEHARGVLFLSSQRQTRGTGRGTCHLFVTIPLTAHRCSKLEKKHYYPVFKLAGFTGFDGDFK